MYIDSSNNRTQRDADQPVAILLRANVEPLLVKYNVNLALWGHHHSYQVGDIHHSQFFKYNPSSSVSQIIMC